MDVRKLVGGNIRRLRLARGVSQEQLANDSGVDRAYMSALERATRNPGVLVLEKIAKALDAPIAALFEPPQRGASSPKPLPRGRHANSATPRIRPPIRGGGPGSKRA